jgi:hypothetical protein
VEVGFFDAKARVPCKNGSKFSGREDCRSSQKILPIQRLVQIFELRHINKIATVTVKSEVSEAKGRGFDPRQPHQRHLTG